MFDLIIIGSGSAGSGAAFFADKHKLKTLVIAKEVFVFNDDDFYLQEIAKPIKEGSEFVEVLKGQEVVNLEKNVISFTVQVKSGKDYYAKAVIIAVGDAETNFELLTYKNSNGKIKVNQSMETNVPGIFAAGRVIAFSADDSFISVGQGAQAVVSAKKFLDNSKS